MGVSGRKVMSLTQKRGKPGLRYQILKELKNFIETFKVEAEAVIPAGRQTDPRSKALVGKESDIPDEALQGVICVKIKKGVNVSG